MHRFEILHASFSYTKRVGCSLSGINYFGSLSQEAGLCSTPMVGNEAVRLFRVSGVFSSYVKDNKPEKLTGSFSVWFKAQRRHKLAARE